MIHLITYGNYKCENTKKRLIDEAKKSGWFNTITSYGPEDLDTDFKEKFKDILKLPRIAGYGIWRPYIINKKLKEINNDDILIYLDAGCTINNKGKKRFFEYIKMLNNNNCIISFNMPGLLEKYYTTKEIFSYFNINMENEIANTGQILDGILIMKKNSKMIQINNIWLKVVYDNPLLFTDYYNKKQASYFKDNRHEQSIFSIIRKMHNPLLIKDETYFKLFGNEQSLNYPFWATRKKY